MGKPKSKNSGHVKLQKIKDCLVLFHVKFQSIQLMSSKWESVKTREIISYFFIDYQIELIWDISVAGKRLEKRK